MSMKRVFDFLGALLGLMVVVPLLLLLGLWVKVDSPGPMLFRQKRVGKGGRLFSIYKFRTMISDAEQVGPKITAEADGRITKSGRFMRRYKLDELPQLFNVLKGDMSFVGPRPEVPEFVAYYPDTVRQQVLSMRPGITDDASLAYRNEGALLATAEDPVRFYIEDILPQKLERYVDYVHHHSLWGDIKIIFRTLLAIAH